MEGALPQSKFFTKKRMLFTGLQFMFWASFAILPYNVVFMRERGLDNTTIGLILSINSFIGIIGQPFWGFVSDWIKSIKKVFMFCFAMCTVVYIILPFTYKPLTIGIVLALEMFFKSSVTSLLDTWIVSTTSDDKNLSYGSVRLWGSIGFAVMVFIYGRLIEGRSVTVIFPIYFVLSVLTFLLCIYVKYSSTASLNQVSVKELKPRKLFTNYYYMVFIVFVLLLNIPNSPAQTFIPNLLEQAGGNREQYGLMMSIKAFFEVPFFMCGRYLLNKFGPIKLVIMGACIYMVQQFLFAGATSPFQVIFAQALLGPAYSLFLLGLLHYVFELAPDNLKATAQTMASALGMGLSAIIGNYGGGIFIDHFGLKPMYWLGGSSDIVAITLFILSFVIGKYVVKRNKQISLSKKSLSKADKNC